MITSATTSTTPLIEADWVRPGTHISAMGSDKVGKQEVSSGLLERTKLYADYPQQSLQVGEIQHLCEPKKTVTPIGTALLGASGSRRPNRDVLKRSTAHCRLFERLEGGR